MNHGTETLPAGVQTSCPFPRGALVKTLIFSRRKPAPAKPNATAECVSKIQREGREPGGEEDRDPGRSGNRGLVALVTLLWDTQGS